MSTSANVAVIGAGSWGTALAQLLAQAGHAVTLWAHSPEVAAAINDTHHNPRYLSGETLSERIVATANFATALSSVEAILIVTPSSTLREVAQAIAPHVPADCPVLLCSKGIEATSSMLPIDVLAQELGNPPRFGVLSGPNHAEEVIQGMYSAAVVASAHTQTAENLRNLMAGDSFRVYTSNDPVGVELCAAFKNVLAIAVGVAYGLGLGDNAASALITRGLAEMGRLVRACGGEAITCMGLAGAGDVIATCMSKHSRNRRFGEQFVARGRTLDDFTAETHMVVEGAYACEALRPLAQKHQVDMPILECVYQIVWQHADALSAAQSLFERPLTTEFHDM